MPELPEVETVARQLNPLISGHPIRQITIFDRDKLSLPVLRLTDATIQRVFRVGKQIAIELHETTTRISVLLCHLRMTGRLIIDYPALRTKTQIQTYHPIDLRPQHLRAEITLDDRSILFVDPRRFGTLQLLDPYDPLCQSAVDPLSPALTLARLRELIAGSRQPAKVWLMRQNKLMGIGNIYASEILFRAKIDPRTPIGDLSQKRLGRLLDATRQILTAAIDRCGTTFSDFQTATGEIGGYQRFLNVYNRERSTCRKCRSAIRRIIQAQRSTFFCPHCQR